MQLLHGSSQLHLSIEQAEEGVPVPIVASSKKLKNGGGHGKKHKHGLKDKRSFLRKGHKGKGGDKDEKDEAVNGGEETQVRLEWVAASADTESTEAEENAQEQVE